MIKRRERIERWRAERKKKDGEFNKKSLLSNITIPSVKKWNLEDDSDDETEGIKVDTAEIEAESKNFKNIKKEKEDPDETELILAASKKIKVEEPPPPPPPEEEPEVEDEDADPLEQFMKGIEIEVKKINKLSKPITQTTNNSSTTNSGVMIVTGTAKKQKNEVNKGELIEQNQDGLEYSSEEEQEDIKDTAANLANKQKKELAKIDHSSMNYITFRKNFYVEVPEIAKMTNEEVELYRVELEGIQVKGKGCPKPIRTWAQCGISKKEMDTLRKLCFEKPTPIQCQAIPAIMSGRDIIGIAKTGSGKTISFILPMFRHILDQPPLDDGDGPIAIVMTPTRELCMQIGKDIRKFSKSLNLRAVCVYGGTGISEQIAELKRGAEIIVCTPGEF